MLAVALLAGCLYGWLSLGWADVAFYGGGAALIAIVVLAGMPWVELAPDGAWRREPEA